MAGRAEQHLIARIFDFRKAGVSYGRIAKRLNGEGITGKKGGSFYASTIWKIAGNDLHRPAVGGSRQRELWPV